MLGSIASNSAPRRASSSIAKVWFLSGILCSAAWSGTNLEIGKAPPDFTLNSILGEAFKLRETQGQIVLLTFLSLADVETAEPNPTGSQLVFLKSMAHQYKEGLRLVIVQAPLPGNEKEVSGADLINSVYNWQLQDYSVLLDRASEPVLEAYGVRSLPTTFLIDRNGNLVGIWEGLASAPQLSFALEALAKE
jgi:cytochrome c-type biogenesis protein